MNKDIIYIDAEDDITAVIGKIKASKEKIVALVPPKRTGMLQSAVNLRLLSKIATKSNKKLVLITNNKALIALTAAAKIPHAKNLQSKPEMAEIAALEVDDGEDVIDGANLPIGELAKTADAKDSDIEKDIDSIDVDKDEQEYVPAKPDKPVAKPKNKVKVPNFNSFRKKMFLIAAGAALFVTFMIWAIWFAPSAKIIITAKTEAAPVSSAITLVGSAPADYVNNMVPSVTKTVKKDVSVTFTATGSKMVGEKANGIMNLTNESLGPVTVPSGSVFSSGQYRFTSDEDVTIPGASGTIFNPIAGTATVNVTATSVGAAYNLSPRSYTTDASNVSAEGGQMGGGSSRKVTAVTAMDVQKAKQTLVDQSTESVKKDLEDQFNNEEIVVGGSFNADMSDAVSKPAIGEEVSGKATLTSSTTFSLTAVSKSELEGYLRYSIDKQIENKDTQQIYDTGIKDAKLSGYEKPSKGNPTANVEATGQIGPKIDKEKVKDEAKGKHYGDIQAQLEGIKGVDSVDIKFSYFWVNTVPKDDNKIKVEFRISNA